jgi:dienelactone hydrolase
MYSFIYQGKKDSQGIILYSEIYQVTGPVERFAGQIASHGYVVGGYAGDRSACPILLRD